MDSKVSKMLLYGRSAHGLLMIGDSISYRRPGNNVSQRPWTGERKRKKLGRKDGLQKGGPGGHKETSD
jgi:hypothetical protein